MKSKLIWLVSSRLLKRLKLGIGPLAAAVGAVAYLYAGAVESKLVAVFPSAGNSSFLCRYVCQTTRGKLPLASGAMPRNPEGPTVVSARPRTLVVPGFIATQFSAMNSCQAKTASCATVAADPAGTSCGTLGLMKFGGRVWADAGWTPGRTQRACDRTSATARELRDPLPITSSSGAGLVSFTVPAALRRQLRGEM